MRDQDVQYEGHSLYVQYTVADSEPDVGFHGGAEIEAVSLEYKGKYRKLDLNRCSESFIECLTEQLDTEPHYYED